MSNIEKQINLALLEICEEILPKTSMRSDKKINNVLKLIREHLKK